MKVAGYTIDIRQLPDANWTWDMTAPDGSLLFGVEASRSAAERKASRKAHGFRAQQAVFRVLGPAQHARIPASSWIHNALHGGLSKVARCAWVAIALLAPRHSTPENEGYRAISYVELAQHAGICRRSAVYGVSELKEAGLIRVEQQKHPAKRIRDGKEEFWFERNLYFLKDWGVEETPAVAHQPPTSISSSAPPPTSSFSSPPAFSSRPAPSSPNFSAPVPDSSPIATSISSELVAWAYQSLSFSSGPIRQDHRFAASLLENISFREAQERLIAARRAWRQPSSPPAHLVALKAAVSTWKTPLPPPVEAHFDPGMPLSEPQLTHLLQRWTTVIQHHVGEQNWKIWLENSRVLSVSTRAVEMEADSDYLASWLMENLRPSLEKAWMELLQAEDVRVRIRGRMPPS